VLKQQEICSAPTSSAKLQLAKLLMCLGLKLPKKQLAKAAPSPTLSPIFGGQKSIINSETEMPKNGKEPKRQLQSAKMQRQKMQKDKMSERERERVRVSAREKATKKGMLCCFWGWGKSLRFTASIRFE